MRKIFSNSLAAEEAIVNIIMTLGSDLVSLSRRDKFLVSVMALMMTCSFWFALAPTSSYLRIDTFATNAPTMAIETDTVVDDIERGGGVRGPAVITNSKTSPPTAMLATMNLSHKDKRRKCDANDAKRGSVQNHVKVWDKPTAAKTKLLCWVMTYKKNHATRVSDIYLTWAKRCDKTVLCSNLEDKEKGIIDLGITETGSIDVMIEKSLKCWDYIFDKYRDEYDYFIKADDDTYVVVENLRHFLDVRGSIEVPFYAGRYFKSSDEFNAGGAGYVLNRKALDILICEFIYKRSGKAECPDGVAKGTWEKRPVESPVEPLKPCVIKKGNHEDVMVGRCLRRWGYVLERSLDDTGADVFHWGSANSAIRDRGHQAGSKNGWVERYQPWGLLPGKQATSRYSATFHYVGKHDRGQIKYECALYGEVPDAPSTKGLYELDEK